VLNDAGKLQIFWRVAAIEAVIGKFATLLADC